VRLSAGGSELAAWPATGTKPLGARSSNGNFEVALVPIQYTFGGSSTLADTSAAAVDSYRTALRAVLPVPEVEITVHAPLTVATSVRPNGSGWSEMLDALGELRVADAPAANVFYVAAFTPPVPLATFCGSGCVTALSPATTDPGDTASRQLAALWYPVAEPGAKEAIDANAGLSLGQFPALLGRLRAPCGGAMPVDPSYPHADGKIGVWGYEPVARKLLDPNTYADYTSYCTPVWTSDYSFQHSFEFLRQVHAVDSARRAGLASFTGS
jgi:hypothetical protein